MLIRLTRGRSFFFFFFFSFYTNDLILRIHIQTLTPRGIGGIFFSLTTKSTVHLYVPFPFVFFSPSIVQVLHKFFFQRVQDDPDLPSFRIILLCSFEEKVM